MFIGPFNKTIIDIIARDGAGRVGLRQGNSSQPNAV